MCTGEEKKNFANIFLYTCIWPRFCGSKIGKVNNFLILIFHNPEKLQARNDDIWPFSFSSEDKNVKLIHDDGQRQIATGILKPSLIMDFR